MQHDVQEFNRVLQDNRPDERFSRAEGAITGFCWKDEELYQMYRR
jgi:hypothetical protein